MMRYRLGILVFFVVIVSYFGKSVEPVQAQGNCPEPAWCYIYLGSPDYTYAIDSCSRTFNDKTLNCDEGGSYFIQTYFSPQNTDVHGDEACWSAGVPEGCNLGWNPETGPEPPPGQPNPTCEALEGMCAVVYRGNLCSGVPCQCKAECGCDTSLCGGTPSPTPTPAPGCTLSCPGEYVSAVPGGLDGVTAGSGGNVVKGASTLLAQSTGPGGNEPILACGSVSDSLGIDPNLKYGYGYVEGNLEFEGRNGFVCDQLYSCTEDPTVCPEPTIIGGDSSNIKGAMTRVLGAASDHPRIQNTPFGEVLGAVSSVLGETTLLAQSVGGDIPSSGQTTTWTKRIRVSRLDGSDATTYSYAAVDNTSNNSCSCSIVLGCFESQQPNPNAVESEIETCNDECNFSFDEGFEYPTTVLPVNATLNPNTGFERYVWFDWDDGNPPLEFENQSGIPVSTQLSDSGTYDVKLTCQNAGNNTKTCTRRLTVYCEGTDPLALPTPTPTPPEAWMKLKDSTYHSKASVVDPVPGNAEAYDLDDVGVCDRNNPGSVACASSGDAGTVVVQGGVGSFGVKLSDRDWIRVDSGYSINTLLTPSSFIEYVRARKDYVTPASLTPADLIPGTINLYSGNVTIDNNDIPDILAVGLPMLIVIDGDLTIDMKQPKYDNTFNGENKSIAFLVTGNLDITEDTWEMNGIFIANTIDFASDVFPITTNPLKVNGNIASISPLSKSCHEQRQRDDNRLQPSCFFTFDFANQYLPLIELISTRTYEWTELVP